MHPSPSVDRLMAVVTPVTLTSVVQRKSCRMGHTVMLACASARTGFADDMGDEAGLKMLPMYTLDDTRYNRRLVTRIVCLGEGEGVHALVL